MPLYRDYSDAQGSIQVWKYDDSEVFDEDQLISKDDWEKVHNYHPKKKIEYLMIRKMLYDLLPGHQILYRTMGQPFLHPKDAFISISHSYPYASLAVSQKRIGVDLEKVNPKILRIKHKFIHHSEESWIFGHENEVELLTIVWAIKEALYKLHPSKYWSLKKHYQVQEFSLSDLSSVPCAVFDAEFKDEYIAKISQIENYFFAIIEENHEINYPLQRLIK
ncbi:MAG: 4'-phosphopantetheinyl transferase superfamily protein [Bacteroidetes bacterium]|nr:4'-phosphopantetheinyl transferase superfamily protein [Bacteroidota bacterium]